MQQISAITPEKVRFFTCASIKQLEEPELQVSHEDETNNWVHLLFGDRFHELVFLGAIFIQQDSEIPDVVLCLDHKAFEKWLPSTPQPSEEEGVTVVGNTPDDKHWTLISFDQYLEDIKTLDQDSLIRPFNAKTYKAVLQVFVEHMRQRIVADSRTFKRMFLGVVEDEVPEPTADVEAVDVNDTANLSGDTNALSGTDSVDSVVVASSSSTVTAVTDVSNNISDAGSNKRKHKSEAEKIPLSYNGGRNAFKGKTDYKHLLYPPMPKAVVSTSDAKKTKPAVNKVPVGAVNVAEPKQNLNDPAIKKLVNTAATAASTAASKAVQAKLEAAQKQVADMETKMQKQAADMEKKMKKQLADLEEKHAESEDKLKKKIAKASKTEEHNDEAIRVAVPECKETKREQLKFFSKVADKFLIHGVKTLTELKKAGISFTDSDETGSRVKQLETAVASGSSLPISNMIGSPLAYYQSHGQIQQQHFTPCYYQTHASQQSPSLQMIPQTPMQSQHFQQSQQIQLQFQQVPMPQNSFQHCQLPEMQTMSQQLPVIQPQLLQTQFIQPQMMQPQMMQPQMVQPQMIQPQKQFQQQIQPPQMMQPQMMQPQMMQPQMMQSQMMQQQMMQQQMTQSQMTQPQMTQPQMMQPQMMQPVTQQQQPQMQPQLQQQMHPPLQQQVAIASGSGPILQQLSQPMSGSQSVIDATQVCGSYFS